MAYNTIKVKKYSDVIEEYEAAAAITPGMLVEATAGAATIQAHSTSGGNAIPMFALEDELQGNGIDDDYAAADPVQVWIPYRGDIVNALLRDEETITIGELLESDGEGRLQSHVADVGDSTVGAIQNAIVGVALEAVDLSTLPEGSESSAGGDYYNPRILIRIV